MSYYKPSFSQTAAMSRGRGYSSMGSYRGSRGSSWGGGRGGGYGGRGNNRFDSFSNSFDSRSKYGSSSDRYSSSRGRDDFRKPHRIESSYSSSRDMGHRSPDRKRTRLEAPSSRHDSSYGGGYGSSSGRFESSYSDHRRSFSNDRHPPPFSSRRDSFRRTSGPPRGGYRGRISSRGSRGLRLRDRLPRRRLIESSYSVRKRIIAPRPSDFARRLKISKMRSAIAARKKPASEKDESEEDEETKEEKEGEEKVKEVKTETNQDDEKAKKTAENDNDSEKEEKTEDKDDSTTRKSYIKLLCPHCGVKAVTFRKYEIHLQGRTHMVAMRKVSIKQKSILAQMRLAQRNTQNELEKNSDDLAPRTNFCPLCKLNYKQRRIVHQNSDAHRNMKKFLMPYCKLCSLTFKSPMMYESHCCSIEHLKRKQRVENGENSEEDEDESNLENFTTIDSVGVDGEGSEEEVKVDVKEVIVNVGIEQIRKVEAYYCDLCKMYVGRGAEETMPPVLAKHCKQRTHMQRYIRYKEDKDLEKRAEKLQRKEIAEKEDKERVDKGSTTDGSPKIKKEGKDDDQEGNKLDDEEAREEEARDDKLWADVDKDLDDILEKEGNKSSDEDEDLNGERYDRFKYSKKNAGDKKGDEEVKDDAVASNTEPVEEK